MISFMLLRKQIKNKERYILKFDYEKVAFILAPFPSFFFNSSLGSPLGNINRLL